MHLIKVKDIWKYESYLMRQRKEGSKIMEFTFPIIAGLVVVLIFKLRYHHWETGDYFGLGINLITLFFFTFNIYRGAKIRWNHWKIE